MNNTNLVLVLLLAFGLIVISVFWNSIQPVVGFKDQVSVCMNTAATSCRATGQLPQGWYTKTQSGLSCWEATSGLIRNSTGTSCADYVINI